MIITLELLSSNMTNTDGVYTQYINDLPYGKRVKIINIISVTGITTASITSPFLFWNSNLIQNNSFDNFSFNKSNTLQVINHTSGVVAATLTNYNTDTLNSPFDTVIPQNVITVEKRIGLDKTLLVDDVPFYLKIIMETIDEE